MPLPRPRTATSVAPELGTLLGQARRVLWSALSRRLEAKGQAAHAFQLLNRLAQLGSATQVQLAEATAQHPAAVSRLLDEVERAGLVRRARAAADRRKHTVQLTAQGKKRVASLRPEVDRGIEEALARLSGAEQKQLAALLQKLIGPAERSAVPQRGLRRAPRP